MIKKKKQDVLITEKNFNRIKQKVKKIKEENKNSRIVFSSEDDELNRKVLEKVSEVDILMIPLAERKDFMKQRNSGFNNVIAKAAKKNNVSIGIDFDEILDAKNSNEKSKIISRIMQNVFLCNKNKLKMAFISNKYDRDLRDIKSLGLVLGMPTWMTKSLEFIKLN